MTSSVDNTLLFNYHNFYLVSIKGKKKLKKQNSRALYGHRPPIFATNFQIRKTLHRRTAYYKSLSVLAT